MLFRKTTVQPAKRLFRSQAVENEIIRVQKLLRNSKLAWMFTNCFPNTLDTTVHFRMGKDGKPDTFVYTGDIHAMWLRDSGLGMALCTARQLRSGVEKMLAG